MLSIPNRYGIRHGGFLATPEFFHAVPAGTIGTAAERGDNIYKRRRI